MFDSVLIKPYFLNGELPRETKELYKCFQNCHSDTENSGLIFESATPVIVNKICDRRLKVCEFASTVGISSEQVHNILHQHLDMKKL